MTEQITLKTVQNKLVFGQIKFRFNKYKTRQKLYKSIDKTTNNQAQEVYKNDKLFFKAVRTRLLNTNKPGYGSSIFKNLLQSENPNKSLQEYAEKYGVQLSGLEKQFLIKEINKFQNLTVENAIVYNEIMVGSNLFINDSKFNSSKINLALSKLGLESAITTIDGFEKIRPIVDFLNKLSLENYYIVLPGAGSEITLKLIAKADLSLSFRLRSQALVINPKRTLIENKPNISISDQDISKLNQVTSRLLIIEDVISSGQTLQKVISESQNAKSVEIATLVLGNRAKIISDKTKIVAGVKVKTTNNQIPGINTLSDLLNLNTQKSQLGWQLLTQSDRVFTLETKNQFLKELSLI